MNIEDIEQEPASLVELRTAMQFAMAGVVPYGRLDALPDPLPVPVIQGQCGPWTIDQFTLTDLQAYSGNLKTMKDAQGFDALVKAGTYTRLVHKDRGVVMSNTPMEVLTNIEFINAARGRIGMNGLGMGMALLAVLSKPEVDFVQVYEIDGQVVNIIAPAFQKELDSGRLRIHITDAYKHTPYDENFDVLWHDIWDHISDENIIEFEALRSKWEPHARLQMFWAEDRCHRMKECMEYIQRRKKG